jgi:DNA-binding NtrC family response regulator
MVPMSHRERSSAITVLFVDDEPAIRRAIVRALVGSAYEVLVAESAEHALVLMRARSVDVLVSDIDMPGMSGLDLLKIVRREFPATVRMLLTGAGTLPRTLEAINEGEVHRFFTKPFDLALFSATMSGLIERIARLRRDHEREAQAARRDELFRWVEATFPGTLSVARNASGEVVVEVSHEDLAMLGSSPRLG